MIITKKSVNSQKIIIESLAMDLKRVSLGLQKGSFVMANRFKREALARENELESQTLNKYLRKLVVNSRKVLLSESLAFSSFWS